MTKIAIIGGTGLTNMQGLEVTRREMGKTPYGSPSSVLKFGELYGTSVVFLARHGDHHTIPPHRINYRANLWALKEVGVECVIAVGAVGGITQSCAPGVVVIPDQIIDYTYDREHTYFDGAPAEVHHIDFTFPYTKSLREQLIAAGQACGVPLVQSGCYAATQGPRLESAAEITRLGRDGCDIVGMTGMPEAALARELGLDFACCATVVNWGAGIDGAHIEMSELEANVTLGIGHVQQLLQAYLQGVAKAS